MFSLTRLLTTFSIGKKLAIGFSVLIALSVINGLTGIRSLGHYGSSADAMARTSAIQSTLLAARLEEKNFLLTGDESHADEARQHLQQGTGIIEALKATYTGEQTSRLDNIRSGAQRYSALLQQLVETRQQMDTVRDQLTLDGRILEAHMNNETRLYLATAMFKQMQRDERNFLITGEEESVQQFDDRLKRTLASIKSSSLDDSEKDQVLTLFNSYASTFHQVVDTVRTTRQLEQDLQATAQDSLDAAARLQQDQVQQMDANQKRAMTTMTIATIVAILIGIALSWLLSRQIVAPLQQAVQAADDVAGGDLRATPGSQRKDESGQLLNALGTMIGNLRSLVHQIHGSANAIADSTTQLTSITRENSRDVGQQRDQIDQVATAMNEMVATVGDVARNAEQASEAARAANDKARAGEQAVSETLQQIDELNRQVEAVQSQLHELQDDTRNIGTVLDVIKSVAEQTNLLALNAAIEAARAGEQGRGFAVVADEVRALAQRTQTSASEIETLITRLVNGAEDTVAVMTTGAELASHTLDTARQTGDAIREITGAVDNIHSLNQQIATAAEQQAAVAEDINRSLIRIRDVSDRTATASEQVSGASSELADLGERLRTQVDRFTV